MGKEDLRARRAVRTGNSQLMKELNMAQVLEAIRRRGPISRIDIARETELSPPTVSSLVEELLAAGIVEEKGVGASIGGRRPVLLALKPEGGLVLGVDLTDRILKVALVDLAGKVVRQVNEPLTAAQVAAPTQVLACLEELSAALLVEVDSPVESTAKKEREKKRRAAGLAKKNTKQRLLGIGVSFPGIVALPAGTVHFSGHFPWENFPLKEALEARFARYQCPIEVENNVRALALGEKWFGAGRDVDDLIVVRVGRGIGAGIILNGRIYRGANQGAGEIGHLVVAKDGPPCSCGGHGCLEAVAAEAALLARWRELKGQAENHQKEIKKENKAATEVDPEAEAAAFFAAVAQGEAAATQTLREAGGYLGIGIASLINLFSPTLILLAGRLPGVASQLLPHIEAAPPLQCLPWQGRRVRLIPASLGPEGAVVGAATLILSRFFASPRLYLR